MATDHIHLRGITWDHSRGFTPMVATAQRYSELHPNVTISWEKRSLQAFADLPIEQIAGPFDLLVIDHPFAGYASQHAGVLLDLNQHASPALLADHAANSVGSSHASYEFADKRFALAIDAAAPVSGWREDLLARHRLHPPQNWEELIELARGGFVAVAGLPVDCLMNFFMCCHAQGEEPGLSCARFVGRDAGTAALVMQRELMTLLPPVTWTRNPIKVWDALAHSDDRECYCPFAYGYSNYARPGYAPHTLRFGGLVRYSGRRLRGTLGGTGLGVSAGCPHLGVALDYAAQVTGLTWQRTLYVENGGQPAHRAAWLDAEVNRCTAGFFSGTLATLDEAWMRPRHDGYLAFQDRGGILVRNFLLDQLDHRATLAALDAAWRDSFNLHSQSR